MSDNDLFNEEVQMSLRSMMYPGTAEEYAIQLNKQTPGSRIITDPQTWAQRGVHTGEDLAHYRAKAAHYEMTNGKYSNAEYDQMSVEELEDEMEELRRHGRKK